MTYKCKVIRRHKQVISNNVIVERRRQQQRICDVYVPWFCRVSGRTAE